MSNLSQFFGVGVRSIHRNYFNSLQSGHSGAGEDAGSYLDITLSPGVTNTAKCVALLQPGAQVNSSGGQDFCLTARLTSTTNLRISALLEKTGDDTFTGQYIVIEFY